MNRLIRLVPAAALAVTSLSAVAAGAATTHGAPKHPVKLDGYTCTVVGTAGNDNLVGHAGDVVCGLSGNDTLTASGSGTVVLLGGSGKDTFVSSSSKTANDIEIGGTGPDTFSGGPGNTTMDAGSGTNTETAGSGSTTVNETEGTSTVTCAAPGGTVTVLGANSHDHQGNCHADKVYNAAFELSGAVVGVTATTVDVRYSHVSDATVTWLAANGNPPVVTIDLSAAKVVREGGGAIQLGDHLHVAANAPSTGTTLTGLFAHAYGANATSTGDEGTPSAAIELQGAVTAASSTTITVTYGEVNSAGLSWLAANANPTSVTIDISTAHVERHGGGAVATGDRVEVQANAPTTGTTLVATQVEAAPAPAGGGSHATHLGFQGTVLAVTATSVDVTIASVNDAAKNWLIANSNPTDVTFDLTSARIEREGGGALTVGDRILVSATAPATGTTPVATFVEAAPAGGGAGGSHTATFEFQGTVVTAGTTTATVTVADANKAGAAWLSANGNPTPVSVDLSTAQIHREGGGSVQSGDRIAFTANAPTSGTTLVAIEVEAGAAKGEGNVGGSKNQAAFAGTISAVGATTIDVTIAELSDNAKAYLAGNGSPSVVTFDISGAEVLRDGGGTLSVGDKVAIAAPLPTSGVVFAATLVAAEPATSGHGDGGGKNAPAKFAGTVAAVGATTIDVTITELSDNARAYLGANGSPTTVTFDISGAKIFRDGGGSISVGDTVGIVAPIPASGVLFRATAVVAEPAPSGHGHGH